MIRLLFEFFKRVRRTMRQQHLRALLVFVCLILYSTTGFMYFELPDNPELGWGDALWWSVVTMTTVGYGDFSPGSGLGRMIVGFPTMLLGISILGYILSVVATAMIEAKMREVRGMNTIDETGHVVLCHFKDEEDAQNIINELRADPLTMGSTVVVVDDGIAELPASLQNQSVIFVHGDPSREEILAKANAGQARAIMIMADTSDREGADNRNLRVALTVRQLYPKVFVVVECLSPEMVPFFRRLGCGSVVCIAALTGQMLVQEVQDPGIGAVLSELSDNKDGKQLFAMRIRGDTRPYSDLRQHYRSRGHLLIGIRRDGKNHLVPPLDMEVREGDMAILIADDRPD